MDSATLPSPHIKLFAPSLPQANKFGISAAAAAHLMVTIRPYARMDEGDLITLFWDGCYVASKLLTADDIGQPLALRVPESFVQSGTTSTWYEVQKIGMHPTLSPSKSVLVKLDRPGGNLASSCTEENQNLTPLTLPDALLHNGLTAKQLKKGIALTIEAYPNMAAKDEITLRWGDVRMDLPAINPRDVGKPITIKVPPAMILEAGEDPSLEVTYCVIDLVGNNSRWAPSRILSVAPLHATPNASIVIPKSMFI
ncbi:MULTISPECIES: hypothetical protein [unclassified Pseudomonas]|uniref:hypothetical protein n=1 Tax=unclassified Pseudomonas TaxID=196821 RepID=UPI002AC9EF40|nr:MULTISPECIES: hypothetical protein [unclassified Pseudomonas]MEB0039483.1 hypothetical protein [Pseudomonas sp. MH10]MEB0077788.1 hypothetical protein [Pseudomonas sp. MH10out]MEB0092477.1 hypothetical protein [Pseudomonas sp. CCI4.2]MEB0103083.1 hypothetical protein [Pseudomonas sp. CCI3.2]MEB0122368.1 hypothetical protein [Pseudomonas sp. CCI1.2]